MFWLVILIGALIVGGGIVFWGIFIEGLGVKHVPPPKPVPLITSAEGTSARSIRLTLGKAPGQVLVQRYWAYDGSTYDFLTSENDLVDHITLPEIADLLPEQLFKYRARYTSSTTAPWSQSQPENGKEGRTLAEALKGALTLISSGWEGWSLVQRFEARALSRSGDKISITLRAGSAGASIDRIYLSQANPAAGSEPFDSVDYRATMQDTAFAPPLVIPPAPLNQSNTVTLPAILYTFDHTKPLLIAIDFSATPATEIMYRDVPASLARGFYKEQAPLQPGEEPEARKTDRDGYTPWPAVIALIERIDIG
jgi:hypothetical protein